MNPVVHFELPADDRRRMIAFYTKAFGWKAQQLGPDMGNYVTVSTSELDEKTQFPKKPGMINGGFFDREPGKPDQYPSVVIAVDDITAHMQIVKDAGGEIIGEPMDIPGIGKIVLFRDTEGNRLSMLQPASM